VGSTKLRIAGIWTTLDDEGDGRDRRDTAARVRERGLASGVRPAPLFDFNSDQRGLGGARTQQLLSLHDERPRHIEGSRSGLLAAVARYDDMTTSDTPPRYDVALSFAGEERNYVERVATALAARGVPTFYDGLEEVDLWGKDLYTHLAEVYGKQARFTVMFISKHYVQKMWTNHERRAAQDRAIQESREYILPARFDDTVVPGVLSTTAYIDIRAMAPDALADLIARKVASANAGPGPTGPREAASGSSTAPAAAMPAAGAAASTAAHRDDARALLAKVQNPAVPLAQCLAEALALAHRAGDASFEEFCAAELGGVTPDPNVDPAKFAYRTVEAYCGFDQINPRFAGWGGDPNQLLAYMKSDTEHFFTTRIVFPQPVAEIQRRAGERTSTSLMTMTRRAGDLNPASSTPDAPIYCVLRGDGFNRILDAIRAELTRRLLTLASRS
jgi:TIR domain